ncbi:MAG: accessory gene regulator B family protein [Lachnospiraceae bacterium]|nr:accessory gene regulator B family protein [Lachnospiraceae bacterium]
MISNSIAFYLQKNGYIEERDIPIYRYGLSALCNSLFQTLIITILGLVTDSIINTIVFMLIFVSSRRYVGGYHASTRWGCLAMDILAWWCTTRSYMMWEATDKKIFFLIFIVAFSLIVTFKCAPIENIKKPLSLSQKRRNMIKGRICMSAFSGGAAVLFLAGYGVAYTMITTLLFVAILMLAGRRKNVKGQNV